MVGPRLGSPYATDAGGFAFVHATVAESGPTATAWSGPTGAGGGATVVDGDVVLGGGAVVVDGDVVLGGGAVVVDVVSAARPRPPCFPEGSRTATSSPTRSSAPSAQSARNPSATRSLRDPLTFP
jgi:hypothetical protein